MLSPSFFRVEQVGVCIKEASNFARKFYYLIYDLSSYIELEQTKLQGRVSLIRNMELLQ